ncbi:MULTISPECIES: hypothetical protein [unclassified Streptomyces]|uniref:hypothetical protein n=1 Tax=unclassified Streptomyces TaxID=2593676 RepID=UPI00278C4D46|nr:MULTISPECIES: hypothetical protein [unclassified Streptomyces]
MDLLDWHRGELSSRRLSVLVEHLPRDSALTRELHGDVAEWGVTDYLLAHVVDLLQDANWMFATVNRDEDSESLDTPKPIPRPGQAEPVEEDTSSDSATTLPAHQDLRTFLA